MATLEQQVQKECDLLNDDACNPHAKEETPKTSSNLVVDTKLKQAEVQAVPVSASTAGTIQAEKTKSEVVEKVVEKAAVPDIAEVRHELLHLHDKIDGILGHRRSHSAVSLHRISYGEPYEKVKSSYAYTSFQPTTSFYSTELYTPKKEVHSEALKAMAVERAREYMLEVNGFKKPRTQEKEKTSSVYHSQYLYSKPIDISTSTRTSSLYNSSIFNSAPRVYTATIIRVPSHQVSSYLKPAYTEKVKSSAVQVVDVKDNCNYCGHEIVKKQVVEREVRSAAPQREEQHFQEAEIAKKIGKRREILDARRERSAQRV